MAWRMGRVAASWAVGSALVWGSGSSARAQSFGPPVVYQAQRPSALATLGTGYGNPYANPTSLANPYMNPMMNPFLNPYMTQVSGNQANTLMYFMAAQQARGGIGSSTGLGGSQEAPIPGAGGSAQGAGRSGSASAGGMSGGGGRTPYTQQAADGAAAPAGRVGPVRPRPNAHVAGRFDDNPAFNDRRGRLGGSYPAYGSVATDASNGNPVNPGRTPAPNARAAGNFNRFPSYNTNNDR